MLNLLWFLLKFLFLGLVFVSSVIYFTDLSDPRVNLLILLAWALSGGIGTISFLEFGDWLSLKRRK